jgi:phospholipase D
MYSAPVLAAVALILAAGATAFTASNSAIVDIADLGPGEVCFTTGKNSSLGADCAALVANEIAGAKSSLLVQAYNFTEPRIIQAIIDAAHRGVAVTVLVDKLTARQRGEGVSAIQSAGIATYVDAKPRIAHNKVTVIDGETVLTGSLNYSTNATCCNAENLLIVRSPQLAAAYAANFERRRAVSAEYIASAR